MLEVKQVSKLYENQRGVHDVDFTMERGEIVGFLGPNGAGKTTTMRMITGYLNPTRGTIRVDGLSMADQPKKARQKIGYLPETPPLYPELSVQAYLKFIADLRDIPVRNQKTRIGEVIERLGLTGRERQIIRGLSKGYKQRLGLAQAILHEPDLLVLDEPTSGLDPKQIIEIRQLIRELGEKHTVLLSTHILPEINSLCNRVLIINQGTIVVDGQPERLAQSLNDRFELSLEVKGPRETVLAELAAIPGVTEVREASPTSEMSTDGLVQAVVASQTGNDIREAVFYRMAEQRLPIVGMKRESLSLEDIFLKLTTDEKLESGESGESAQSGAATSDGSASTDSEEVKGHA
ncbi:ABC transporter ATP-binding protein [Paenibacillus sp. YYML68]|uniref:ABC transporter ATP-binding protein n=1 Tax=Paenibacillus sp. YYML68 TaxID=2909250 RepID=UPI00249223BE|nr:ABC transporter ATP-binding protein [Paenibacillus sp. YYML68]